MSQQQQRAVVAMVGMGSNLEQPQAQLRSAFAELAGLPGTQLLAQSSLYRTAPMGKTDQPDFVNAVAMITTTLPACVLLEALLEIEHKHGRVRSQRNGPRTLDLDLLLYGDARLDEPGLQVPHPRMHERRFVLEPLLELDPGCVIPGRGRAADCLASLEDTPDQRVERIGRESPQENQEGS